MHTERLVYLLKNNIELVTEIKKSVFYTLVIKTETVADFEHKLTRLFELHKIYFCDKIGF